MHIKTAVSPMLAPKLAARRLAQPDRAKRRSLDLLRRSRRYDMVPQYQETSWGQTYLGHRAVPLH